MTRLEFSGEVDAWGYDTDLCSKSPTIGDRNVIEELDEHFEMRPWRGQQSIVTVYLGVEPIKTGPLWALAGFGGTEATPPEPPEIEVGDLNLLEKLRELDEREVVLVITDEEGTR